MKKKKNKDVVFRRIRGRIVPIKRKRGSGAKTTAGGIGLAVGGGAAAGALAIKATTTAAKAAKLTEMAPTRLTDNSKARFFRASYKRIQKSKGLFKSAFAVRSIAGLAGGAIAAAGIKDMMGVKSGDTKASIATDIGVVGGFLAADRAIGRALTSKKGKQATEKLLRAIVSRKFKVGL